MKFDAEIKQAEILIAAFGTDAAQHASDRADRAAQCLHEENAASWRRVTALILASSCCVLQSI